jgi:hypothetical protein
VTGNCVVQDRLIFVMYKAENSYNKTKDWLPWPTSTTRKKKKKLILVCLHKVLSNRNAQTDFHTVQDSKFLGQCRDLTQSTVTTPYDDKGKKRNHPYNSLHGSSSIHAKCMKH